MASLDSMFPVKCEAVDEALDILRKLKPMLDKNQYPRKVVTLP